MWISLSLFCALFFSVSDVFSKIAVRRIAPDGVAWARYVFCAPMLLVLAPFSRPPSSWRLFLLYMACALPLELVAAVLYSNALKRSPLSLTAPFLAFTPVCILLTGWIFLGEKPGAAGIAGVLLVAAGAYVLSLGAQPAGVLGPFKNFAREPGSVMMLGVAVLFAFTATLGKSMIQVSSPLFQAWSYNLAMSVVMTFYLRWKQPRANYRALCLQGVLWGAGAFWALMNVFHVLAISVAQAAYMMSLKRTSLLFSVLFGLWLFREGGVAHRLPGAVLMLCGVVVLAVAGG